MAELGEFERSVLAAVGDDAAWARLQVRHGPKQLQQACHQIIGALVDEHRQAIAELAGEELVRWLYRHRKVRGQVEARLGQPHPARTPAPRPVGWARMLHRLMDAAAAGWTLEQTMRHHQVTRRRVQEVFDTAGVPLPWQQGGPGRVSTSKAFRRSVAVMRVRLAEAGVPEAAVAELGTWLSPPPRTR